MTTSRYGKMIMKTIRLVTKLLWPRQLLRTLKVDRRPISKWDLPKTDCRICLSSMAHKLTNVPLRYLSK